MDYTVLDNINSISDVKTLSKKEVDILCSEIRDFLIDKVGHSGGHLASNLGVVELTVALHRVFDSPRDHIIFDVGHQSYVHKLLTGRRELFDTLRTPGGLSGFTVRKESEHDPFGCGHSSTSLSAALGFAEADKLLGKDGYTVAVVGDGAMTGGLIHEALNNCKPDLKLIVIINENGMSISSNKGAFASYLSNIKMANCCFKAKNGAKTVSESENTRGIISSAKNLLKRGDASNNFFEELGFYYIGVIDGNDQEQVEKALAEAKSLNRCVIVHLKTRKGKGLKEAERSPELFHSVANGFCSNETFHSVFADSLIHLAARRSDVVAVTAAMGIGTGLSDFEKSYPDRYFDVGIAEAHALTFSAGLAANGLKPFTAIYSTFLQRGYDSIVHDIALQNLPVKMFIDRAGLAVNDGATHHGIFDVAFLSHIPDVEILAPIDYDALRESVEYAYNTEKAIAVRYPNAKESALIKSHFTYVDKDKGIRCDFDPSVPPKNIYVTYGMIVEKVIEAKNMLSIKGIDVGIVLVEIIKPYIPAISFISSVISEQTHIVYVEEGIKNGGAAMITKEATDISKCNVRFDIAAIDDTFANPEIPCDIYDQFGLSARKLAAYFDEEK